MNLHFIAAVHRQVSLGNQGVYCCSYHMVPSISIITLLSPVTGDKPSSPGTIAETNIPDSHFLFCFLPRDGHLEPTALCAPCFKVHTNHEFQLCIQTSPQWGWEA